MTPIQGRATLFGRNLPYSIGYSDPAFWHYKHLLKRVYEPNFVGRWIADPATARKDDDLVIFYVHGGGFVIDTAGLCQTFWLALWRQLNEKDRRKVSIFQLDYELAPEFVYPSQIIETIAAYSHLVHTLGIAPERICLAGDSAGASIAISTLLHLARPNPEIALPPHFRAHELRKPGSALLISPFVKFVSKAPSRSAYSDYDLIEDRSATNATLDYIGGSPWAAPGPTWWPHHIFTLPEHEYDLEEPELHGPRIGNEPKIETTEEAERIRRKIRDPYLNPSMVADPQWWRDAMPAHTLVTWGGREVFADDVRSFCVALQSAGVNVQRLVKPYGAHDWVLYDWTIPLLSRTISTGPDSRKEWGVERIAVFLDRAIGEQKHGKLEAAPVRANL